MWAPAPMMAGPLITLSMIVALGWIWTRPSIRLPGKASSPDVARAGEAGRAPCG